MRRAGLVVVLLALAGCRSGHMHRPPSGAIVLRPLPAQGLVVEERRGVALLDLRGRRVAWLRGFAVYPRSETAQASRASFISRRLPLPLLHGPRAWYRLDVAQHMLLPVRQGRVPLVGGASAVAPRGDAFIVERRGRVLLRGSADTGFSVLSDRLVQGGATLLDLATGRRWRLPPDCLAAGFMGRSPILACGMGPNVDAPLVLERLEAAGVGRRITQPVAHFVPQAASLSPDRTWVAPEGVTGCASSYVYVAPARGGVARLVYGRSATHPYAANFSELLGWSGDGRLVVVFTPPYCDDPIGPQHPPKGVYLVDPRTLARTFVTRSADAMWSTRTP